jgi:hypothetical protein
MRSPMALLAALALAAPAASGGMSGALAQAPQTASKSSIGSEPASTEEIVTAVGDCVRFVKHHGQVDTDGLKAAGWQFARKEERPGQGLLPPTVRIILGKGNVILILHLTGISAGCQTIGRLDDMARADEVRSGIAARFGAKPYLEYKGDDLFKAEMARQMKPDQLDNILISDADRFTISPIEKGTDKLVTIMMIPRILD